MEKYTGRVGFLALLASKVAVHAVASAIALISLSKSDRAQAGELAVAAKCDRTCMADLVDRVLESMVAHNPDALPLATVYRASENSHPAALGMMTLWASVSKANKPDFLTIDVPAGQAFLATQISEGGDLSVLWGRIKVVDRKIAELELFVNRSRGDHGFSFSADKLPENLRPWMNPPAKRKRAARAELEALAHLAFAKGDITYGIGPHCSFIEAGSHVIDPGLDDAPAAPVPPGSPAIDPNAPLGCVMPAERPLDPHARPLVIDEELGVVVVGAIVPGTVFPYPFYGHMMSAFIPSQMAPPTELQQKWFERKVASQKGPLLEPTAATGDTMEVYQVYDGQLQGHQINVHVGPVGMRSAWLK